MLERLRIPLRAALLGALLGALARCGRDDPGGAAPDGAAAQVAEGWKLLEGHGDRGGGPALALFVAARAVAPDEPLALAGEGIARTMGGDAAGGEPLLRAALAHEERLAPRHRLALTRYALANLLLDAGRGADAEPLFRAAAAAATTGAGRSAALVPVARIALDGGRLDDAALALDEALAASPENEQAHYVRSVLLRRRGATAEADHELRLHTLLRSLEEAGRRTPLDVEEVLRIRADLIAAWPECEVLRLARIRFLIESGRFAPAQADAAALLESGGPSAPLAWLLARAHAGSGDLAAAGKARSLALRLDPGAPAELEEQVIADWRRGGAGFSEEAAAKLREQWRRPAPKRE
jgi:tetratricopeptide (TPR) repeat protein